MKQAPRDAIAKALFEKKHGMCKEPLIWEELPPMARIHYASEADYFLSLTGTIPDGIEWRMGAYREDGKLPEYPVIAFEKYNEQEVRDKCRITQRHMIEANYRQLLEG